LGNIEDQEIPAQYGSLNKEDAERIVAFKVKNPVIVTTIGLVIHCVADGLALGTSVYRNKL
jgi:hypothetical protein